MVNDGYIIHNYGVDDGLKKSGSCGVYFLHVGVGMTGMAIAWPAWPPSTMGDGETTKLLPPSFF